jgi:PLD-like domain
LATRNGGCMSHVHKVADSPAPGGVPVMVVGHLGNGIPVPGEPNGESPPIPAAPLSGNRCSFAFSPSESNDSRSYEYRNPGEDAVRALVAHAKHSVFISQQDLLSCLPFGAIATESKFDDRLFAILGAKIADKVPIRIVVSPKATADYSNGWTLKDVGEVLKEMVAKQRHISLAQARQAVCSDVGLTTIHSFAAASWPGNKPFRNHAKLVSVDDHAFYIGSQNLYPARLQELGLIVEDPKASADLKSSYLDPIWKYSSPYALIDPPRTCGNF